MKNLKFKHKPMFETVHDHASYLDSNHNYRLVLQTNSCKAIKIATKSSFYLIKHYHTSIRDKDGKEWYLNELNENITVRSTPEDSENGDYFLTIFPMSRVYKARIRVVFFLQTISVMIDSSSTNQYVSIHVELENKPIRIVNDFENYHLFRSISSKRVASLETLCSKFILTKELVYDIQLPKQISENLNQLNFVYSDLF